MGGEVKEGVAVLEDQIMNRKCGRIAQTLRNSRRNKSATISCGLFFKLRSYKNVTYKIHDQIKLLT